MKVIIDELNQSAQKALSHFKDELNSIRTGKSNPALLESLVVETYGGQSKLKLMELATILTEGPTSLIITPFDPTTIADIEKAILKSPLGISPLVQSDRIIAKIPPLSAEQREKFVKLLGQKSEEKKNVIRFLRDEARKKIRNLFVGKEITEDEKFRLEKEIDLTTQNITDELQKIKENKEKEIMEL